MADEFQISAIITANSEQFAGAMQSMISAVNEASQALRTQLTAGAEAASEALDGIGEKSQHAAEETESAFGAMRESAMRFAEVLGVFEGINLFREAISSGLEFGENMERLSVETGATTEFLQQLKFAATATGSSFESVTAAARRLTQVYSELRSGSGSPQLLGALSSAHIDVSQLGNIQSGIEAIANAVKQFGANSEIARNLVVQLLGRGGLDFLPMLNNFDALKNKAEQTHSILSGGLVESLGSARESLNTLGAVIEADAERFTAALAPAIKSTAELLTGFAGSIGKLEESKGMEGFSRTLTNTVFDVAGAVVRAEGSFEHYAESIVKVFREIQSGIDFVKGGALGLAAAFPPIGPTGPDSIDSGIAGQLADLRKAHDAANAEITKQYAGGPTPPPPNQPSPGDLTANPSAAKIKQAQDEALQAYQQQLQAYTEEQATEVALANNTAQAKVQAATNVYEKAVSLLGQTGAVTQAQYQKEVNDALRAGIEELNARRELLSQTQALAAEQIQGISSEQLQQVQITKATLAEELAAHQITKAQELQGEQNLVSETLALETDKYSKLAALYAGDAKKQAEYAQQTLEAQQKAELQMIELHTQALNEQEQNTKQAANSMAEDFSRGLSQIEDAFREKGQGMKSIMQAAFGDIESIFNHLIESMAEKWLENSKLFQNFTGGMANGGGIMGGIKGLFGGAPAAPGAPGVPGATPGIGSQIVPPGSLNLPIQQGFQAAGATLGQSFQQAFQTSQGVLNSLFSNAMRSAGSAAPAAASGGGSAPAAAGSNTQLQHAQVGLAAAQLGVQMASLTHLGKMSAGQEAMQAILMAIEMIDLMIALEPSIFGNKAEAGAFVGPGFGSPVNDGRGGMVGIVHPGELILPASHVDPHTQMPSARALRMPSYSAAAQRMLSNESGGDTHHHVNISFGDTHALDGDGMDEVLSRHGDKIAGVVMDHLGRMGGREKYR